MSGPSKPRAWADGPFKLLTTPKFQKFNSVRNPQGKLDQYIEAASVMAVVHNIVIRGLNSIYLQARNVAPADYKAFIGYCLCWYELIDTHHNGEETFFFPEIERITGEKGLMDKNVAQHEAFHNGVEAFSGYLTSLAGKEHAFSGVEVVRIIDTFGATISVHLADEIPSLLELSLFGDSLPLSTLGQALGKRTSGSIHKTTTMMFFFLNQDLTYEDGLWQRWPPIPPPVRWTMIRLLGFWHSGWWKFASCDYAGKPQELFAKSGS